MKENDVLVSLWGYEQTNATFYKVVRATEKTVWLREIKSHEDFSMGYIGTAEPIDEYANDKIIRRRYSDDCVSVESYSFARIWNGKPVQITSYY